MAPWAFGKSTISGKTIPGICGCIPLGQLIALQILLWNARTFRATPGKKGNPGHARRLTLHSGFAGL
jgi:hypothetical protein